MICYNIFVGITTNLIERGITMEVFVWAMVFVFFVIAEIVSIQLVSIWFAVGALITLLCTYFFEGIPILGQLFIFIISSSVFLAISIPYLKKRHSTVHVSTNSDLDVGKQAVVIEDINMDSGTGRVTLNGVDWSALPAVKDDIIPSGSIVVVEKVQGAKLIVSLKK